MAETKAEQPRLKVELVGQPSGGGPWRTTFKVANRGDEPIEVLSAWLPHNVYHAEAIDLAGRGTLVPNGALELSFDATYAPRDAHYERPNPFLMMRVIWRDEEWRVLVQLSLGGEPDAPPEIGIARINAHRVGFSTGLA